MLSSCSLLVTVRIRFLRVVILQDSWVRTTLKSTIIRLLDEKLQCNHSSDHFQRVKFSFLALHKGRACLTMS